MSFDYVIYVIQRHGDQNKTDTILYFANDISITMAFKLKHSSNYHLFYNCNSFRSDQLTFNPNRFKPSRYWPLCGELNGDRRIPRTKGQ